ncbi:acyltransferase domain-containing protein [Rhizobium mongolense]|uniref:Acyl transferase domain-containing protein n=1 Tax=Rhizobium mongolense TaxID=57676 RepID=A0A7W6RTJ6_9HYPH|nr:acyltransferase domain-containing protein [Rhizobium mongolense]MBB4277668.1 acyl transferase domain-containing protein [Rhizobium mongolense]
MTDASSPIFPLSARSARAFDASAAALKEFLLSGINFREPDLVETMSRGRRHFSACRGVVYESKGSYNVRYGEPMMQLPDGQSSSNLIWTFPGQGMQLNWDIIGQLKGIGVFRDHFNQILDGLRTRLGARLFTEKIGSFLPKTGNSGSVSARSNTIHDQGLVFAVELSLSALWLSCGIRPAGVVGHSVGEIAAAVSAGVLALDEALDLIVVRSVEMERVPEKGFMCQVDASAELLQAPLLKFGLEVACKNCLNRTVVAGPEAAFEVLETYCSDNRLRYHRLNVANAFHSEIMAPASQALRDRAPVLTPETPLIPIFPTCSAQTVEPFTRDYWATQMRSCVDFIAAVERVLDRIEAPIFLEVGLGQALSTFTRATAGHNAQAAFGVVSGIGGPGNLVAGKIADLFAAGYAVPWHKLNKTERGLLVPMPTYRFSQFEIASTAVRMQVTEQYTMSLPPLGRGSIRKTTVFEISPQKTEWLKEHRINGAYVVPGAGILAMIFEFLLDLGSATDNQLNNVVFEAPLVFNTAESRYQIGIQVEDGEQAKVALYSRTIGKEVTWTRNAVAVVNSIISWPDDAESDAMMEGDKAVASESFYAQFARQGLEYGPQYKRIEGNAHAEKAFHARLCSLSNSTGLTGLITALNAMLQAADCAMAVQEAAFSTASIGSVSLRDAASSAKAGTILAWVDGKRHVILCDAVQKPICVMRDVGGSNHRNPIAYGIDTSAAPTDRPVLSKVAQVLGVGTSSLDLNGSLSDNGVDSLQLIELRLELQEISDTYIPLSLLSDGSSLDEIEREFAAMRGGKSPILSVAPVAPASETVEQPRPKIFFVEGIFGHVGGEAGLRDSVKDSIDVIGLGAPGSGTSDDIVAAVRQMADEVELRQPNGPLRLVGHSFGAMLVYSLAVEFGHRGREIEAIVAIDGLLAPALSPHHIPRLDDDDFNQLLHKSRCKSSVPNSTAQTADRAVDELKRVFDKNCRIAASAQIYAPVNYHVTLVLPMQDTVTGITEEVFLQNVGAIQAATSVEDIPSVRVLYVDGDHFSMIRSPGIDEVGRLLVSHASSTGPP